MICLNSLHATYLTISSRNTTFEQQPIKTPTIAKTAFNCMIINTSDMYELASTVD